MNKITFTSESKYGIINHTLNLSSGSTWLYQIEGFRKFLNAQGYSVDKRIAIVEPKIEGTLAGCKDMVTRVFYDQIEEAGWQGEVMPQDSTYE